jgi:preprotein translocase subunit YajC
MTAVLLAQDQTGSPLWSMIFPIALMFFVCYFLMIVPARRQAKQQADMLAAMKKNDKVVTSSGIIGWVVQVNETEVTLKVDPNNANFRIQVLKSSITQVLNVSNEAAKEASA